MRNTARFISILIILFSVSCSSSSEDDKEKGGDSGVNLPNLPDYSNLETVAGPKLTQNEVDSTLKDYTHYVPESVYNNSDEFTAIFSGLYDFTFSYFGDLFGHFKTSVTKNANDTVVIGDLLRVRFEESTTNNNFYYDIRKDKNSPYVTILTAVSSKNFRSAYMEMDYYAFQTAYGQGGIGPDSKYRTNIKIYNDRIETRFANKITTNSNGPQSILHYSYGSAKIYKNKSGQMDYYFYSYGLGKLQACKKWTSNGTVSNCN